MEKCPRIKWDIIAAVVGVPLLAAALTFGLALPGNGAARKAGAGTLRLGSPLAALPLPSPQPQAQITVAISPASYGLTISQSVTLVATVANDSTNQGVTWSVSGTGCSGAACGTLSLATATSAQYTSPTTGGVYSVTATSVANTTRSATATIGVTDLSGVFTYRNDGTRTGINTKEYVLSPSNVNTSSFGKLFSCALDGNVYAQPLWVANVAIGGGTHNVVIVATQHDSVYAFDADNGSGTTCTQYWKASLLTSAYGAGANATPVPPTDTGETQDIQTEIGITSTPVIDPANNNLFVVSKTKESGAYFQRLHKLNLSDGTEKTGAPVTITASVTGSGDGSSGNSLPYIALRQNQRSGLALVNGTVYLASGSHGDISPWHGWILGFNSSTLTLTAAFCSTPNTGGGGIWMSGSAPVFDTSNNLFVISSNGTYDGNTEFADSFLKLSTTSGLAISDWFTPDNQATLGSNNIDLGQGGAVTLMDSVSGPFPHLVIGGGKGGILYLVNRDNMGHFRSGDNNQTVQNWSLGNMIASSGTFWQNTFYIGAANSPLQAYAFNTTTGLFNTSPTSQSNVSIAFPGLTPVISASGTSNAILWTVDSSKSGSNGASTGPAVLYAFDPSNLANEFWDSTQATGNRDQAGNAIKFVIPTVANGKVYVGSINTLTVYGLLGRAPSAAAPTFSPAPGSYTTSQNVSLSDTTSGATIYYTLDGSAPTTSSSVYSTPINIASTKTINAMAAAPGLNNSPVASGDYTIQSQVTGTISFVQGDSATPQTSTATVSVAFTGGQTLGNLNVVVVGWNDTSATVNSVTDSKGNVYQKAVGPTAISGVASQSIYYAKNIAAAAAGANVVTVSFSAPAAFPDIRILEYAGADPNVPVDVTSGSTGNSGTSTSAAVTTQSSNDLLFGANLVQTLTTGPGTGFTTRILTVPDGDIAEDRLVSTTGSYSATAVVNPAGQWIMQMVAFRALGSSGGDTTPPTAPTNLTATPVSDSQINLSWTASTDNVGVTGYLIERCDGDCSVFSQIATTTSTTYTNIGLTPSSDYTYRVRATDAAGNLSSYSNITVATTFTDMTPPTAPSNLVGPGPIVQAVQGYINSTFLTTHTTAAFDSTGGDAIVVFVSSHAGVTMTPSDSFNNTWISAAGPTNTSTGFDLRSQMWYAKSPIVGPGHTFSITLSTAESLVISVFVVKGSNTVAPIDAISAIGDDAGTQTLNVASPNITATSADDLLIGFAKSSVGEVFTSGTGFTAQPAASSNFLDAESEMVLPPGTYDSTFTLNSQATWQAAIVAVEPPAIAVSASQIRLSWTASSDNVGVTGYLVERCQGAGCSNFLQVATSAGTTYTDTGLTGSTLYSYRVRATDAAGNLSTYSNTISARTQTQTGPPPPTAPGSLTATAAGPVQINLTWTASTETGGTIANYLIERCAGASCSNFVQVGTSATTTFNDTGLSGSTSYSYRVRAIDTTNVTGPYSNTATATTAAPTFTAPTNLAATASGSTQANLTWTAATETGGTITQYLIERCAGASCSNFVQVGTSATTTFNNTGLLGSTSYSYRVRATDAANNVSAYSNTATATTAAPTFTAPTGLTATAAGSTQVNLTWTAATETGGTITQYLIERCTGASCSNFAQVGTSATTTFNDTGLLGSTSYSYRVRATDASNNLGPYSNSASVTTPANTPSAPGSLTATAAGPVQINLTWTASTETGGTIANYLIERCAGASCSNFVQVGTSATTTFNDTGLSGSTSYSYRVRAIDTTNVTGPYSNTATATTAAPTFTAPTNLAATASGSTQANLTWTAATETGGTITQYLIERCAGASCSNFVQVGTSATTTFNNTGLLGSTSYSYRVRATDAANNVSAYSNTATATTAAPTFTAPTGLTATAAGSTQVNLTWTAATETGGTITQYLIERCTGASCSNFAQVGTSATTTFNDTGLLAGTSYSYRVRATDASNNVGPYSNIASATTSSTPPPPITFVQGNSATPQSSPTSVPITYLAAQAAGDLNIIVVGWSDATRLVSSVADSKGNVYTLAVGPTVNATGALSQSIYYAKNIAAATAGGNIVTVTFNGAAAFPDIRILEYSGADPTTPVEVVAAATGNTTSSSVTATTTGANDLLLAANTVQTVTTGPGTGFTSRMITTPDGDIAEDRLAATPGSYTAAATVNPSGQWVMQMVALRIAGGGPSPTAPGSLTATAAGPMQINLTWTASTETGGTIANYLIERCAGASCSNFVQVGTSATTTFNDTGLSGSTSYSYRVRAIDTTNVTGPYSNTATATTAAPTFTAPTNLAATASGSTQANLTWTAATETGGTITQYLIERCAGASCSNFVQVGTSATTTFNDTGLLGSTSYSYRVRATDAANNVSAYSNTATATTAAPTFTAPTNLAATASGSTQVNLTWTAATETGGTITQYLIERCTGASCSNFAQVGTSATTTFNDTGLSGSTSYSYRVRATDASNNLGPYSNSASVTTPANTPSAPGSLTATAAGPVQINLTWTASTETGGTIANYLIERCAGASCSNFVQVGTSATTTFNDTGLSGSTSYSYRVRAIDTTNVTGPYSNTATATTAAPTFTAPTNLAATASGSTQANLTWTAATETGGTITQYLIERCAGASCSNFVQVGTSATTTFNNTGLLGSTSYSYRVRATDAANNVSAYSNTATTTTAAPTLTAPTNLTATAAGSTQVNLTWTAATEMGGTITQYLIERCAGASCSSFAQVGTSATTTFNDTGLLAGTSYSYRVRATDASNNVGPYSNIAGATTSSTPPPPITFVQRNSAVPQTSQVTVAIPYTLAQVAGDLNIIVVGWNDSTAAVSSITDSSGNLYSQAIAPTVVSGTLSQTIYYAKNIVAAIAGSNTVTVNFSVAAAFPDIRILEYSGIDTTNPLDVSAAASGNSATSTSAAVTTTNANDLIVGANMVSTLTSGPGAGFTSRVITSPDGDIAEDRVVSAIGSYNATAPLSSAGPWIMQMVTFKAHP